MNLQRRPSLFVVVLVNLLLLHGIALGGAGDSERRSVLEGCERLFGAALDEKEHLFEVNRFYVLRVSFGGRGYLRELAVEPKYFHALNRPEWEEPKEFVNLSQAEFETLLVRLGGVKTKGALVRPPAAVSIVTNMTARHRASYEHAALEWGAVMDLRRPEDAPVEVRWLRVTYTAAGTRKEEVTVRND